MDVAQQNVHSALSAILASTAAIVTLTGTENPSDINYTAVGAAITTMLVTNYNLQPLLVVLFVVPLT